MKNLLILLLLPTIVLGQLTSSTDGIDIDLNFVSTTLGETDIAKVQVNDTIILKLDLNNLSDKDITYIHADVEYNSNAFTLVDHTFNTPTNANNSLFSCTNTKWTPNSNYDENDLWAQWNGGGGSYGSSNGWNVDHWQAISTTAFEGTYVTMHFLVKDTSVSNYTDAINITMARVADNSGTSEYVFPYGEVRAYETQSISFVPLEDLDSNIYVKVDFNSNIDPTNVKLIIVEDGTLVGTVQLDSNGDANITEFITKSESTYTYNFVWDGTDSELSTLKDNIVTISDVALTLKEAGEFDHGNTGEVFNVIQYVAADVNEDTAITAQDAYNMLGHVLGQVDLYSEYNTFEEFAMVVPATDYNALTTQQLFSTGIPDDSAINIDFTQNTQVIRFKGGMFGDANLSHTVSQDNQVTLASAKSFQYGMSMKGESFINADYSVALEDGKVVATLEILSNTTAALQLKLDFDNTRLTFEEVIFNVGNTSTNFATAESNRVNVGVINQQGDIIENGSTIQLIFSGNVDSTVGLVTIFNTDAASLEGKQQILKLQ